MSKSLTDYHNEGEKAGATSDCIIHASAHSAGEVLAASLFGSQEDRDQIKAENDAYNAGFDNARRQK